jgi:catechol 2,3-dioxygenase-like lactoylglutathione lyase family enzyme
MPHPTRPIDGVLETILYVDDLEAARAFYQVVLGLELYSQKHGVFAFFKCGRSMLLLFNAEATLGNESIPVHGAKGPGHVCFAMGEDEFPAWQTRLRDHGISIEQEVTWPNGAKSFYFRDPAGNSLELGTPKIWGFSETQS